MIAYSTTCKPLQAKAIDKLVGNSVVFVGDESYFVKKNCSKEYLTDIHKKNMPYLIAPKIQRNDAPIKGALNPRYAVLSDEGSVMILNKDIISLDRFSELDGVMYSSLVWNQNPQKCTQNKVAQFDTVYKQDIKEVVTMGTNKFEFSYCTWNSTLKRWLYNSSRTEKVPYDYPDMFYTHEGFINWKIKPDLYSMHLKGGKTDKSDLKIICAWCTDEINETKKLVELNGITDWTEKKEIEMQICSLWLLMETCKNLAKANKKIDIDNLTDIIDSINVRNAVFHHTTLPQYMHIYAGTIVSFV